MKSINIVLIFGLLLSSCSNLDGTNKSAVQVSVLGAVIKPGRYTVDSDSGFTKLASMAGGFRDADVLGETLRCSVTIKRMRKNWPIMLWSDHRVNREHIFLNLQKGDEVYFHAERGVKMNARSNQ